MQNIVSRRRSMRLAGYDYRRAGVYSVTDNTHDRTPRFGTVRDDATVALTPEGQAVQRIWRSLPERYPYVTLYEDIVMPDHFHGLLEIRETETHPIGERKALGSLVGAFKSMATSVIRRLNPASAHEIWQSDFYDHIVRDERSLAEIRACIAGNPQRWLGRLRGGR
jgi:REP element-mobilizing transposase RayT